MLVAFRFELNIYKSMSNTLNNEMQRKGFPVIAEDLTCLINK